MVIYIIVTTTDDATVIVFVYRHLQIIQPRVP